MGLIEQASASRESLGRSFAATPIEGHTGEHQCGGGEGKQGAG